MLSLHEVLFSQLKPQLILDDYFSYLTYQHLLKGLGNPHEYWFFMQLLYLGYLTYFDYLASLSFLFFRFSLTYLVCYLL